MLEVLSALTGESIAVFQDLGFAEGSVKALKQRLAQKIGSFKTSAHWTTSQVDRLSKVYPSSRPPCDPGASAASHESRIRASWWPVARVMANCFSSIHWNAPMCTSSA